MESYSVLPEDPEEPQEPGAVSIELNFKAFADNVPTHRHARRAKGPGDPSVQDFADQVLELAALRAELKRLSHDYQVLQQQASVREARLDALHDELIATRRQLRDAQAQRQPLDDPQAQETTIALEPVPAVTGPAIPHLVPLDQPDLPMALSGDIVTIGRTRNSDICIESRGVSRDHARLLLAPGRVTLVDVSTTNGCFVNGALVKRHRLRDGDVVRIGDRSFRFALNFATSTIRGEPHRGPAPAWTGRASLPAAQSTPSQPVSEAEPQAVPQAAVQPVQQDDPPRAEPQETTTAAPGVYWNLG